MVGWTEQAGRLAGWPLLECKFLASLGFMYVQLDTEWPYLLLKQ